MIILQDNIIVRTQLYGIEDKNICKEVTISNHFRWQG